MKRFLTVWLINLLIISGVFAATSTPNLNLTKPDRGDTDWHTSLNSNFDKLDSGYGNNVASIADLPEVYIETGTFNHAVGDVITLPKSVDAINEYNVTITQTTGAGTDVGMIYVAKGVDDFTVYCTGNNHTDTYSATIYYIGDVASYGGSIYRRWYVSPDAAITDHGDDTDVGSLAWILDQIGISPATVEFPGNKAYVISTAMEIDDNIKLIFQKGAILTDDVSNADLILNCQIEDSPGQQIFDWGNGTGAITWGPGTIGEIWADRWGITYNNDAVDNAGSIQAAIDSIVVADSLDKEGKIIRLGPGEIYTMTQIDFYSGISIVGSGCTGSEYGGTALIAKDFGGAGHVLHFDETKHTAWWHHGKISDMQIISDATGSRPAVGIDIHQMGENALIENMYIKWMVDGIVMGDGTSSLHQVSGRLYNISGHFNGGSLIRIRKSTGLVEMFTISGDDNTDNLIRIEDSGQSLSVMVNGVKSEADVAGNHEPAISVEDSYCDLVINGGYLTRNTLLAQPDAIKLSGTGAPRVQLFGVVSLHYTNILNDDTNGVVIPGYAGAGANINFRSPLFYGTSGTDWGGKTYNLVATDANMTAKTWHRMIDVNAIAGNRYISLDDNSESKGQVILIRKVDSSANFVIVQDYDSSALLCSLKAPYDSVEMYSDGTTWRPYRYHIAPDEFEETITADAQTLTPYGATKLNSTSNKVDSTLPDGTRVGQIKTIVMTQASNSSTVTVTNHDNVVGIPLATGISGDGEVGTFDAIDEAWILLWTGTEWTTLRATCTF